MGGSKAGGIGSVAFRAIASTNIVIEVVENTDTGEKTRMLYTEGRDSSPFEEKVFLSLDPDTEIVSLGSSVKDAILNKDRKRIIEHFKKHPDAMTAEELIKAIHIKAKRGYESIHSLSEVGVLKEVVDTVKGGTKKVVYTLTSEYL
jgi:HD superfamily phosphohydrolase